jgi:hypothetical protein
MSDTTPTPRSDEPTPLAAETARELGTGEQPIMRSSDPADHTDTAAAPTVPPGYEPVSASNHVAPEPAVPTNRRDDEQPEQDDSNGVGEPGAEPRYDAESAGAATEAEEPAHAQLQPPAVVTEDEPATATPEREAIPAPATEPEHQAGTQPEPTPAPTPAPYGGPTYLNAPERPKTRSNRGLGILIAVLATVVFAAANLAATYGVLILRYGDGKALDYAKSYVTGWEFWVPVAVFLLAFIALVAIVNRGRWAAYVFGSIFVAALVFIAYFAAALLTGRMWEKTPDELRSFTGDYFQSNIPYLWIAVIASFIALEVVIWFGAWIAFHGQNAKRRTISEQAAWDEEYTIPSDR